MSIGHILFELNYNYHPHIYFFEAEVNPYLRSYSANKWAKKQSKLMSICQQNLLHAQELQNQAYDKGVKLRSYAASEKV